MDVARRFTRVTALALTAVLAAPAAASSVPAETFRAAVHRPATVRALKACYEGALQRDPAARGRVEVRFTVATDGRVRDVELPHSALDERADRCIAEVFAGLHYRIRLPEPARVVYPLYFQPDE